ncbi:hypothetical protein D3C71_1489760 [compost metagenome]
MAHIGRLVPHLGHQDDVARRVEIGQTRQAVGQLIAEHQPQDARAIPQRHDGLDEGRAGAPAFWAAVLWEAQCALQ